MYRFDILKSCGSIVPVVEGGLSMHRPDLIDLLKDSLPPNCSVHLRKRMTTYTTSSSESALIKMHFADGTTATADVLIGADGVRSATRETMFEALANQYQGFDGISHERLLRCKDPVWTGTVAYRCVYPAEKLRKVDPEHPGLDNQFIVSLQLLTLVSQSTLTPFSELA
jgi:salicylate hydroxylase